MDFGTNDIIDEIESPYISGFHSLHPCPNKEGDIIPPVNDTPADEEIVLDGFIYFESLHYENWVLMVYHLFLIWRKILSTKESIILWEKILRLLSFCERMNLLILLLRKSFLRDFVMRQWLC